MNSNSKRLHFGVLFGTLTGFCQHRIWDGIVEYADKHDISLTAYFGTYHTSYSGFVPHYETCLESIKNNHTLDALIILTSSVTTDMKPEDFTEYIERLPKHLPLVSVAATLPGIASVMADSFNGIYAVTTHLIQKHDKRKIALITGPERTWEAEERLRGYKKALEDNSITVDENYILPGNYLEESGGEATIQLLDKRKLDVDAIVSSNDAMASGVLRVLKSRGINVPGNIAVAGFDDDIISLRISPTITTAKQDFLGLGMMSAQIAYDIVNGNPVKDVNFLPTGLIVRQSCGCTTNPSLSDTVPDDIVEKWISSLIDIVRSDDFTEDKLQQYLDGVVAQYADYSDEESSVCDILNQMIMQLLNNHGDSTHCKTAVTNLITMTAKIQNTYHTNKQISEYEENRFRMTISWITNALVSSFDIDLLTDEINNLLPGLHINTILICLYSKLVKNNDKQADRNFSIILGYADGKKISIKCEDSDELLPFDYTCAEGFDFNRKKRSLLFYPLFFGDEELGIAVLSYDARIPMDVYAGLRIDISTAVMGASLISKIHALSITDELTGLLNRRGFFRYAETSMKLLCRDNQTHIPIVLFFDLDKLKYINDTFGHKDGDTAIKAFADILKSSLRETDVIGRLGGDEFIVFSYVDSNDGIMQLEQRIRTCIAEYNSKKLHPYEIATSVGRAVLSDLTMQSLEEAIQTADNMLYDEKKNKKR